MLIHLTEVREAVRLSESTIRRMISKGAFPAPAKVANRLMWRRDDIEQWVEDQFDKAQEATHE